MLFFEDRLGGKLRMELRVLKFDDRLDMFLRRDLLFEIANGGDRLSHQQPKEEGGWRGTHAEGMVTIR